MPLDDVQKKLAGIVGPKNLAMGGDIGTRYRSDVMGKYKGDPAFLVRPGSPEEVSEVLKTANAAGIPVTVIGGQTGTSGGAVPADGGIALSLERMNRIEEIDTVSMTMTVQAGCILQTVQEAVEQQGAFLPLDLGSRGSAMIGGNIASNAGGNRVLRWGMTRDMVIGLEAVLADGTIISSLTKMLKDNAGYNWKHLLIGSEGTLGVITRAVLRLRPLPTTNQTALVATKNFDKTAQLLRRLEVALSGRLSSFEVMWDDFYGAMTEAQLPKRPRPLKLGYPIYILLEALGGDPDSDPAQFERVMAGEIEAGTIEDAVIANSERERQALWAVREDMAGGYASIMPCTVFDVSMGLSDMAGFVAETRRKIPDMFPGARMMFYGHAGDGNLHILVHVGKEPRTDEVEAAVFSLVRTVNGSVAAEHGIGWTRKPYLGVSRTDAELMLMQKFKDMLDPKNILNPSKILG